MNLEYTKGITSEDDIIEHILMRLNTDFAGGSLQVPDFCSTKPYDYDRIMEPCVREKMYEHGVAKRSTGSGQPETAIVLTRKGVQVYNNGGWKKYLSGQETKKVQDTQPPSLRPFLYRPKYQPITPDIKRENKSGKLLSVISNNPLISGIIATVVGGVIFKLIERYL